MEKNQFFFIDKLLKKYMQTASADAGARLATRRPRLRRTKHLALGNLWIRALIQILSVLHWRRVYGILSIPWPSLVLT